MILLIYQKLQIYTIKTTKCLISLQKLLMSSKMSNKETNQIFWSLINLQYIQPPEVNNTILELSASEDVQASTTLSMPLRLVSVYSIPLISLLKGTSRCSRVRKLMLRSMELEECNSRLIILEHILCMLHAEIFLDHMFGKMVLRKQLKMLIWILLITRV